MAGIKIGINWTWLEIVVPILWSVALRHRVPRSRPRATSPIYTLMGLVAPVASFGSPILHAHHARRQSVRTDGISLWLFGGVAKIDAGQGRIRRQPRTRVGGSPNPRRSVSRGDTTSLTAPA